MSELLVSPTAPRVIWHANGRFAREVEELLDEVPWDEKLIKAGLFLFLSLLPQEPSLLKQLSSVYARTGTEIKRVFLCFNLRDNLLFPHFIFLVHFLIYTIVIIYVMVC